MLLPQDPWSPTQQLQAKLNETAKRRVLFRKKNRESPKSMHKRKIPRQNATKQLDSKAVALGTRVSTRPRKKRVRFDLPLSPPPAAAAAVAWTYLEEELPVENRSPTAPALEEDLVSVSEEEGRKLSPANPGEKSIPSRKRPGRRTLFDPKGPRWATVSRPLSN